MEERPFKLVSPFQPTGDQPEAIKTLVEGLRANKRYQVLLGATGTGKTYTIANVIAQIQRPTLVMVHNKTLAGQLYSELKSFFPENRVEYFISNFDFYQPEAYIPKSDTYIEKSADMNMEIEMMRNAAINSALTRSDTIVVASVAAIYALNDPEEYSSLLFSLRVGESINRRDIVRLLINAQYKRTMLDLVPGSFRVRGDVLEIAPPYTDRVFIRVELFADVVERISEVDPLAGTTQRTYQYIPIYPAESHASSQKRLNEAVQTILEELVIEVQKFKDAGKLLEAERLDQRTRRDVEQIEEYGICPGIENYSRHIDKRKKGEAPFTIMDYFKKRNYLVIVDESHVSLPQIRGMYNGDRSRKETLVKYGFRLPSALDNRPLKFAEFEKRISNVIFTSATPGDYEMDKVGNEVVEQIIRPTGLLDPVVEIRSTMGQINDIIQEIKERIKANERTLITTLTIRMAEELTIFLKQQNLKVAYLHNETKTLQRTEIIYELRKGKYDVLVGINLLREGLDIPEVSLILILDADKEGFLRSERSLIQIIGRAARNEHGKVIMYADRITDSMKKAVDETERRRKIQENYNKTHNITPKTVHKDIKEPIHLTEEVTGLEKYLKDGKPLSRTATNKLLKNLEKEMRQAARELDFEKAAELRDAILEIKAEMGPF